MLEQWFPNSELLSSLDDWFKLAWTPFRHIDWKQLLQLAIIGGVCYLLYRRFVRQTQSEQLLKGLAIVLASFFLLLAIAAYFKLTILTSVMSFGLQILIFALIVTFQPEIRRILFYIGQPEFLSERLFSITPPERKMEKFITDLVDSSRFLSKSKTGALIVLEAPNSQGMNYLEAGTAIDAKFTTELLLTIFHPNTPLHDGAVVIDSNNRILSAGVLLPLTEDPKLSWQYGTRHRAAIGLTEVSESACVVVSEETGQISFVQDGRINKVENNDALQKELEKLYKINLGVGGKAANIISFTQRFSGLFNAQTLPGRIQKIFSGMHKSKEPSPVKKSQNSSK